MIGLDELLQVAVARAIDVVLVQEPGRNGWRMRSNATWDMSLQVLLAREALAAICAKDHGGDGAWITYISGLL